MPVTIQGLSSGALSGQVEAACGNLITTRNLESLHPILFVSGGTVLGHFAPGICY